MKKLIDIKEEDVQPLKILAVNANKDLKKLYTRFTFKTRTATTVRWLFSAIVTNVLVYGML